VDRPEAGAPPGSYRAAVEETKRNRGPRKLSQIKLALNIFAWVAIIALLATYQPLLLGMAFFLVASATAVGLVLKLTIDVGARYSEALEDQDPNWLLEIIDFVWHLLLVLVSDED
jgi:hypothetical protein